MVVLGTAQLLWGPLQHSHAQLASPTEKGSFTEAMEDDKLIQGSVGGIPGPVQGELGTVVLLVSGIGAIVAAAVGIVCRSKPGYRLGFRFTVIGAIMLAVRMWLLDEGRDDGRDKVKNT